LRANQGANPCSFHLSILRGLSIDIRRVDNTILSLQIIYNMNASVFGKAIRSESCLALEKCMRREVINLPVRIGSLRLLTG
jgi:hypothetical protein